MLLNSCSSYEIWQSSIQYAGSLGWSSHGPSIWWSKTYFDRLKIKQWVAGLDLEHSELFFIFVKDFWKEFGKKLWKKMILGHQMLCWWDERPIDPAHSIEDCRISRPKTATAWKLISKFSIRQSLFGQFLWIRRCWSLGIWHRQIARAIFSACSEVLRKSPPEFHQF